MADDTFNNDNQESLMGDDEFTEVEATVIEDSEEVEQEESLEAKINHGIGTLDINVGKVSETDFARLSALCGDSEFKGRLLLNAGSTPYLSLRLNKGETAMEMAQTLVDKYAATAK